MSLRALLLGLLLGFAAGWVASTVTRDTPTEAPGPTTVAESGGPGAAGEDAAVLVGTAPGPAESRATRVPDLPTLRRRLREAQAAGDGKALRDALDGLGLTGTPEAHRILLAVLRDPDVLLPPRLGHRLVAYLQHSEVEGVAEAARTRFEIRCAAGFDPRSAASGWFTLIGAHLGVAALDWARAEGYRHDHYLWMELVRGVFSSSRPATRIFARSLALTNPSDRTRIPDGLQMETVRQLAFDTWARLDPEEALPALLEEVHGQLEGRGPRGALPTHLGIQVYASRVQAPGFAGAADLIHALADSELNQATTFRLIGRLHGRGMALDAVEDVVERPTLQLEAMDARGGPEGEEEIARVDASRNLILGAPWAWSDRSLEAVERSIAWERWPADQEALRIKLLEVRTQRRWSRSARD